MLKLLVVGVAVFCCCSATTYLDYDVIPELKYIDWSVDPCDNFYAYTCGNFEKVNPLPKNQYNWDQFSILQKDINDLMKEILESHIKSEDPIALRKAKTLYSSCMNLEYIEQMRLPQLQVMDAIGDWPAITWRDNTDKMTWDDIGDIVAEYGLQFYFNIEVMPAMFNATANVVFITTAGLDNPDAGIISTMPMDFDFTDTSNFAKGSTVPYVAFLNKMAYRLRDLEGTFKSNEAVNADNEETFKYMQNVQTCCDPADGVQVKSLSPEITVKALQEWTDLHFGAEVGMNWVSYLNKVFKYTGATINDDTLIFHAGQDGLYRVLNLYQQTEAHLVKNFIIARLMTFFAPDSDEYMRDAYKEFCKAYDYFIYDREEYCVRKTMGYPRSINFAMALTHEYQKYYFNINKLQSASEMVSDLIKSFNVMLQNSLWMDQESRDKAVNKLEKMLTLLGYPEYVEDSDQLDAMYENLRVCGWDHFGNSQRLRAFQLALNLREIGNQKNREVWNYSPLEANAFYNRQNNRILFPASMINPIFYTEQIRALDYGRIGAIIGHEITHGFDDGGKAYNNEGVASQWWSEETTQKFNERTECFKEQYGKFYIPEIDTYVDSTTTLNENLADNGGLRAAFSAYDRLRSRNPILHFLEAKVPDQLFFIGYGTMWCNVETETYLKKMYSKGGSYPPNRYRVNGAVSNMKEFAKAFNCPVGSNMNPINKCILW